MVTIKSGWVLFNVPVYIYIKIIRSTFYNMFSQSDHELGSL